jgi:hypothetical protein
VRPRLPITAIHQGRTAQRPLLAQDLSTNVQWNGTRPFHCALSRCQVEIVAMLIETDGASGLDGLPARARPDGNDMNLTNGCAPLHYAVAKGQTGMVQFPMETGANPLLANQHAMTCLGSAFDAGG